METAGLPLRWCAGLDVSGSPSRRWLGSGGFHRPAETGLACGAPRFSPVQVLLLDEGTNGLDVHVINETPVERALHLDCLACLKNGRQKVVGGERALVLAPHSQIKIPATDLFGSFFDTTYAYRFAAPQHEVTVATLTNAKTGAHLADAFHFPRGRKAAFFDVELKADLVETETGFALDVENRSLCAVRADQGGWLPAFRQLVSSGAGKCKADFVGP